MLERGPTSRNKCRASDMPFQTEGTTKEPCRLPARREEIARAAGRGEENRERTSQRRRRGTKKSATTAREGVKKSIRAAIAWKAPCKALQEPSSRAQHRLHSTRHCYLTSTLWDRKRRPAVDEKATHWKDTPPRNLGETPSTQYGNTAESFSTQVKPPTLVLLQSWGTLSCELNLDAPLFP